jgi:threonine dehydratase
VPVLDVDLDPARIEEAAAVIDPVFRDTPQFVDEQLAKALGRRVLTKVETLNPLRCFKGRGADFLARAIAPGTTLVCASSGNFGQAIAYAARAHGLTAVVFVPSRANPVKVARIAAAGGRVHRVDGDARAAARSYAARHPDHQFVLDGREPAIAEGAGTIGVELLRCPGIDAIVVPLGDGALISGIARWTKLHAPEVRIVGATAAGAPALERSWRAGRVVPCTEWDTIADGAATREPVPESVDRMRTLVDDVVLVDDEAMLQAMALAEDTLGLLLEPAGAIGIAAIAACDVPGDTVATVLTGANRDPALIRTPTWAYR